MHVTRANQETTAACSRTVKMRCREMQKIRTVISGGEASALIQNEVLILSDEERPSLLDKAGISSSIEIGAAEVLAIKAGLALPWNKLRFLRRYVTTYSKCTVLTHWCFRWLKASGISLAGEERMSHISKCGWESERRDCPIFFSTSIWGRGNQRSSFGIHSTSGG